VSIHVNYELLTDSANALRRIAGDFADAVNLKDRYGKAMGSSAIERALGNFGGNWDRHAKDLVERLQKSESTFRSVAASFRTQDETGAGSIKEVGPRGAARPR
jgi:uncharacterized protein YukE